MKKSRGRPQKHWAEKARIWAWYAEIQRRSGWSDHRLDIEFAWTEEGRANRDADLRPRTFEGIRKTGRQPARGKHWRCPEDLIQAVENHVLFGGTKSLYEAEIWGLLQEDSPTSEILLRRVERLLLQYSLQKIDVVCSPPLVKISLEIGTVGLFDRCLVASLSRMEYFDRITLLWTLYQQTNQAENWEIRSLLERRIDGWLDAFFSSRFSYENYLDFYSRSIDVLLRTRPDPSITREELRYLDYESRKIILPSSAHKSMTVTGELILA